MPTVPSRARASARVAALASLTLFAAACSDNGTGPGEQTLPIPEGTLAMLRCQASVVHATVACEPASDAPSAQGADGPSYALLGAQGVYVRLTTSGVTNGGGVFAFNMTVQNLSNKVMASTDGATRHADGARIFFHSGPTLTGGSGNLAVANATGTGTFTAGGQDYFQYGGSIGGTDQPELGADGILSTGEASSAKNWQITYDAGVTGFSFVLYVSAEIPAAGTLATAAPQVTGISPNPLVPGAAATLTGVNFNATPGNNTVTIGGQAATITGGNTTQLQVTVPCASSGSQPAAVTTGGMKGADFNHPLQVTQRTVAVGQALVLTSAADSYCNELTSAGGAARYAVAVFSASTSPTSNSPFQFSANPEGGEAPSAAVQPDAVHAPRLSLDAAMRLARVQGEDQRHAELLEKNAEMYQRLKARFGTGDTQLRPRRNVVAADPPLTRSFRISDLNATAPNNICNSYYVVSATRVYFDGKLAIYEDDATPNDFKASLNATMAANYLAIGDQFNDDMEPIIATNFGDVLRRDDVTDNNDVLVALSTPRLNTSFSGVAGFVVSCDQFPNDDASTPAVGGPYTGSVGSTNGASNFGEFFYMYQPVTTGAGYGGNTAQNWYRTIRSTFIHETKHVASMAARVANGAPTYEAAALEEGTARHSEE
ncbi:MAG TPA: IPT/TIG domain-containing protein, partial [Longimicrobiaceae bacterium]|nr:IPT/TIG domain-containing protein [Longimicrobiaceae bacterium]